jgi:hypothetical protein
MTINATVTTGNRSVGMLSLMGIRAREAYGSAPIPHLVYADARASEAFPSEHHQKGDQLSIKKLSAGLIAAVTAGALVMASMAGARAAADTGVTIKGPNGDFQGKVLSPRKKCLGDRKVVVYKQSGKKQDPSSDQKIGSDISERHGDHGDWSIGNSGFKKGKFYAKAKKSEGCAAGFSETIKL